jgi:hypothetical protein
LLADLRFLSRSPVALKLTSAGSGLKVLSFLINGNDFTLGNAQGTSSATFFNGSLISLAFAGILGGATLSLNCRPRLFLLGVRQSEPHQCRRATTSNRTADAAMLTAVKSAGGSRSSEITL